MHPDLEKLVVLQGLDSERKRVTEEMNALPKHIAGLAARSAAAQANLLAIEDGLVKEEKLRRSIQGDVSGHKDKAARLRRQMDTVTTTVQMTAFEHEIAFADGEVRRMEDLELESMERTEELEARRGKAKADAEAAEGNLERDRLRAAEAIERGQARLKELDAQRGALRPQIGEAPMATYDRVAKAKGTGIAEGVDGKCSACQMMVRPQKWNDLRDRSNTETIMTCESCGRLLYWDPARDAPVKKAVQAVSGEERVGKAGGQ